MPRSNGRSATVGRADAERPAPSTVPDESYYRLIVVQRASRPERLIGMKLLGSRNTARTFHLPLHRTVLCLDCDECFEIGAERCPVCGSAAWASVARFLEGDMKNERRPRSRSIAFS